MGANLITLEEYKTSQKIESLKDDTKLESLITSVSQLVKTYCGNSFIDYLVDERTEYFSFTWYTNAAQLTESPLISITSVEERASYDVPYTELTEAAYEYYVDYETDTVYRTNNTGYKDWPQGPGGVKIVYNAGYGNGVPEDLKLAIYDIVTYYHKEEYKERKTIGTVSIANQTTSTQWRNVGFPDHIKRILDLYKQIQL